MNEYLQVGECRIALFDMPDPNSGVIFARKNTIFMIVGEQKNRTIILCKGQLFQTTLTHQIFTWWSRLIDDWS